MLHSFSIHIKQCKELWLAREELKDPKERKKLPEDPYEKLLAGGKDSGGGNLSNSGGGGGGGGERPSTSGGTAQISAKDLDELNKLASDTFNNETMERCAFCDRTFLAEKLKIHNRSCTADKPARKVNDSVRRGNAVLDVYNPSSSDSNVTPTRPHTSSGVPARSSLRDSSSKKASDVQRSVNFPPDDEDDTNDGGDEAIPSLKLDNGALVGHMGGASGINIRKTNAVQKAKPSPLKKSPSEFATKEEAITYLTNRLEGLETTATDLVNAISEVKTILSTLSELP